MASPERPEPPTTRLPPKVPPPQPPQQWGAPPYPPQQWGPAPYQQQWRPAPYQEQWAPPPASGRPPVWVWIAGGAILVLIAAFIVVMNTGGEGTDKAPVAAGPPASAPSWGVKTAGNGLQFEVTVPEPYKPSARAVDADGPRIVAFWTTVTNRSGRPIEVTWPLLGPDARQGGTYLQGGRGLTAVGDSGPGWDYDGPVTLAPDKSLSFRTGLNLPDSPVDLSLEFDAGPDFSVDFSGTV
jgi:hypothetical protein